MKINFLGDSITEGWGASSPEKGFVTLVGNALNCEVNNYGIGGTRLAIQKEPSAEPKWDLDFCSRVNNMDKDVDIVFVFGGTNDYGHGDAPFGEFGDQDPHTFYGAVDYIINQLLLNYKKEQIVFILPLYRANENNPRGDGYKISPLKTLQDYREAIIKVLLKYSIKILDIKDDIGKAEGNPLFIDGLHPNDAGYQKIAALVIQYINNHFLK